MTVVTGAEQTWAIQPPGAPIPAVPLRTGPAARPLILARPVLIPIVDACEKTQVRAPQSSRTPMNCSHNATDDLRISRRGGSMPAAAHDSMVNKKPNSHTKDGSWALP